MKTKTHIDVRKNTHQRETCAVCGSFADHSLTIHDSTDAVELPLCEPHGIRLSQVFRL